MESHYNVSSEAQDDLFEIWERVASDRVTLANRIEDVSRAFCAVSQNTWIGAHLERSPAAACLVLSVELTGCWSRGGAGYVVQDAGLAEEYQGMLRGQEVEVLPG